MTAETTRLAQTLLHFLWQGAAIYAVTVTFRSLLSSRPSGRYAADLGGLFAMLIVPIWTFARSEPSAIGDSQTLGGSSVTQAGSESLLGDVLSAPAVTVVSQWDWQLLIVCAWALGAILVAAHILTGWLQLRRLRAVAAPAPANWVAWLSSRSQQLRVTCPQLLVSTWASTPMVLGWLRPVIVLPATVLTGLTQEQIEALLTHELVHLRRLDHLVNLLQVLLETLLFYHPAVWRLSRDLRHDRELCCDARSIHLMGRPTYTRALLAAEQLRSAVVPPLALAATDGSLLQRIRYIAMNPVEGKSMSRYTRFSLTVAIAAVTFVTSLGCIGAARNLAAQEPDVLPVHGEAQKVEIPARIFAEVSDNGSVKLTLMGTGTSAEEMTKALSSLSSQFGLDGVHVIGQSDSATVNALRQQLEAAGLSSTVRMKGPAPETRTLPATLPVTLAVADSVTATVFDQKGARVAMLFDDIMPEGGHSIVWTKEKFHPEAGVYFVRIQATNQNTMYKVLVLD